MNFARTFALAMLSVAALTGCDAIRSALGKPTSEDIAALRLQRDRMRRTADSLTAALGGSTPGSPAAGTADTLASPAADSLNREAAGGAAPEKPSNGITAGADASAKESAQEPETAAASTPDIGPASEGGEAPGAAADTLQAGYYVVLGSFKNEDNARYLFNSLSSSGCGVHLVKMKNGFTAVMICHGDTYEASYSKMLEFYGEKAHPDDIWIYNTNKHLHIQ